MSNVRPHMKTAVRFPLSLRSSSALSINTRRFEVFASKEPNALASGYSTHSREPTRYLTHRSASLSSRCGFRTEGAYVFSQSVVRASRGLSGQFVVGAPRHSAAPGSQSVGAAGYGSIVSVCCYSSPMLSKLQPHATQRKASCPRARPNPSVERTANGGLHLFAPERAVPPLSAAHLKR